ncbi:hypothetical protein D3C87_1722320 [compost metagenome]
MGLTMLHGVDVPHQMTKLVSRIEAAAFGRLDGVEKDEGLAFVPSAECVYLTGFFG